MSEELSEIEEVKAVKPRARKTRTVDVSDEPEHISLMTGHDNADEYEIIQLVDSEEIPPPGQGFGVNGRQFLLFLGIDLVNVDLPVILFRQFFQNRRDHLARAAPARIEIDDTGLVAQELPLFRGRLVIGHFGQKLGFG